MDSFEKEMRDCFLDEAISALEDVEKSFIALESDPNNRSVLDKIFRLAHNLKGSSRAVGLEGMGHFTHQFENFLIKIKNNEVPLNTTVVNILLECNDHLNEMIQKIRSEQESEIDSNPLIEKMNQTSFDSASAMSEINNNTSTLGVSETQEQNNLQSIEANKDENSIYIEEKEESYLETEFSEKINSSDATVNVNLENKSIAPIASEIKSEAIQGAKSNSSSAGPADENIRVSLSKVGSLINFVGEMVILQTVLKAQVAKSDSVLLKKTVRQLEKVTKEVQDISMGLRMLPIKNTFQKMHRIVRDTAKSLNKDIQLKLLGEETELDKSVLERISDPLVHLVRNSVDHGIESAEKRKSNGKPLQGEIVLSAYHQGGKLIIEVKDDGGGIDPTVIRKVAVQKGVIKDTDILTEEACINLIFAPGFSTKAEATDISGRGVGMDVVRTNIKNLGGDIQIITEKNIGTTFKIILPLTLAIIDGLVVKNKKERYVLPLAHVIETVRINPNDVKYASNLGEILMLRGSNLPIYHMSHLMGETSVQKFNETSIGVIVQSNGQPFVVIVDDIIGQSQVVVKQIGKEAQRSNGFTGTTILGDGKPSLILDVFEFKKTIDPKKANLAKSSWERGVA